MFYSQFILAKKGPLGTIWIAAHLERKLRKNQVADTDIGVSVDSILFPEVPIALRLSSHLLLGVVRIYSRKVNYLFHDCSEALLKVKQAFRSTAVDLPPEESTAPYHSITLPETFDLDDFELPDSDIFQGNYVDHHISTREQITLQDTLDGVVYSTSKFGLDERFGDGDASQIGLDLDEELFLDKVNTPGHTTDLLDPDDVDPQECAQPVTPFSNMDIDEHQIKSADDRTAEGLEVMLTDEEHIPSNLQLQHLEIASPLHDRIHSPDLNEKGSHCGQVGTDASNEYAQASSTPKLADEAVLPNGHFQGVPTSSTMMETSPCNSAEVIRPDDTHNLQLEFESCDSSKLVHDENQGNYSSKSDLHVKDTNDAGYPLFNNESSETHVLHMSHEVSIQVKQVKQQVDYPSATVPVDVISLGVDGSVCSPTSVLAEAPKPSSPVSECLDRTLAASDIGDRIGTSQNGVITDNMPSSSFVDQAHAGVLSHQGVLVDVTVASNSAEACSKPPSGAESDCLNSTNNHEPVSKGRLESVISNETSEPQASVNVGLVGDLQESCYPNHVLPPCVGSPLGPVGESDLEKIEGEGRPESEDKDINRHVGLDGKLCPDNETLRACNFLGKESDLLSMEAETCSMEILERENQVDASGTLGLVQGLVQGVDCHQTSSRDMSSEANQMESCPDRVQADLNKLDEPHNCVSSKDNQSDNLKCPSSDLPAPEMLLSSPATVPDVSNNLLSSEKVVSAECEGSGNVLNILSGKKRQSMESTPILQDENSAKLSGVSKFKRTMDSIPDDDDLLSSILVGRRSLGLKMRPTPPPTELASSKRPRLNPRASMPKRKVLLDDTMVLHGDTIRQQLTSTEDIRRTRRKAPCTRPEIWMIQRHLLEDEVLCEPVFTGISIDLISLHNGTYDLTDIRVYDMDADNTFFKVQNETELSVDQIGGTSFHDTREPPVVSGNDRKEHKTTETLVLTENHLSEDCPINSEECDIQGRMGLPEKFPSDLPSGTELVEMPTMDIDKQDNEGVNIAEQATTLDAELPTFADPITDDRCNVSSCSMLEPIEKSEGTETVLQSNNVLNGQSAEKNDFIVDKTNSEGGDASEIAQRNDEDLTLTKASHDTEIVGSVQVVPQSSSQDCRSDLGKASSCPGTVNTLDNGSVENGVDVQMDVSAPLDHVKSPLRDMCAGDDGPTGPPCVTGKLASEEIRSEFGDVIENEILDNRRKDGEGHLSPQLMSNEEPQRDSLCPLELHVGTENVPCGLNEVHDESINGRTLEEENVAMNNASAKESDDFRSTMDGNDTEFLNFDDDDVLEAEEEDNIMPNAEEGHLLDNSGWSSRTRAVAKFLQTLFDKESGDGRKVLPMDNLLSGKTRKEASRMFFETLVLKTRDYIHVEQENPFNNINIKPKVKLMKSDF